MMPLSQNVRWYQYGYRSKWLIRQSWFCNTKRWTGFIGSLVPLVLIHTSTILGKMPAVLDWTSYQQDIFIRIPFNAPLKTLSNTRSVHLDAHFLVVPWMGALVQLTLFAVNGNAHIYMTIYICLVYIIIYIHYIYVHNRYVHIMYKADMNNEIW